MSGFDVAMRSRIFARLMLLQARWSYDRMQAAGLAFALEPWLGERAARHGDSCFNTHPYMAPLTAGMVCGLEEEAAAAPADKREALLKRADALRTAVACSLAGVGDALFWGALRPACAAAALVVGMITRSPLAAVAVYLTAYNLPALWLRWRGLRLGYEWKGDIAARLKDYPFQRWIRVLKFSATALLVALLGLLSLATPTGPLRIVGLSCAVLFAVVQAYRPATTAVSFYAAACVLGMVLA